MEKNKYNLRMVNLFTSYYKANNIHRQSELSRCLKNNIQNELINKIYLLIDDESLIKDMLSDKIIIVKTDGNFRHNFSYYFDLINKHSQEEDINIICNSDIFFDESLSICNSMRSQDSMALSRWEVNRRLIKNQVQVQRHGDSQDAWIFRGSVRKIGFSDFPIGMLGCDNRIAHEIKQAGYNISNPSKTIKCWHLHNTGRVGTVQITVPPPYLPLPVVEYNVPPKELLKENC